MFCFRLATTERERESLGIGLGLSLSVHRLDEQLTKCLEPEGGMERSEKKASETHFMCTLNLFLASFYPAEKSYFSLFRVGCESYESDLHNVGGRGWPTNTSCSVLEAKTQTLLGSLFWALAHSHESIQPSPLPPSSS